MSKPNVITVYEHQKLSTSHKNFDEVKMKALLKLNELHGGKYLDGLSNGVRFKQYVGVIQVDGLTIEILPKSDRGEEDPKWRDVLIQMLKRTGHLRATTLGTAHVRKQNLNLLEVYFEIFLNELVSLQRLGLVKKYRKETKNVTALKGKLEFAGHIKNNLIHKERFYTTHQVYDKDHLIHQVLFVALEVVQQFTNRTKLSDRCNRVLLDFPEVSKIKVNESLLSSISLNRKTKPYTYALELARLIILNYSPDIANGRTRMLSLLFDMNKLWEGYVLSELRRNAKEGIEVIGKGRKNIWKSNWLEPDIVLRTKEGDFIIDTKWKQPGDSPKPDDVRQMYAYAHFWDAKKVMLLYPGEKKTKFSPFLDDKEYQCKMGFVSVLGDEGKLDSSIAEKVFKQIGL